MLMKSNCPSSPSSSFSTSLAQLYRKVVNQSSQLMLSSLLCLNPILPKQNSS